MHVTICKTEVCVYRWQPSSLSQEKQILAASGVWNTSHKKDVMCRGLGCLKSLFLTLL